MTITMVDTRVSDDIILVRHCQMPSFMGTCGGKTTNRDRCPLCGGLGDAVVIIRSAHR